VTVHVAPLNNDSNGHPTQANQGVDTATVDGENRHELEPFDGNPLNRDCVTLYVRDGHSVVARSNAGTVETMRSFPIDAASEGNRQTVILRPLVEHADEL
jgi:hypothetical protein